jgi:serine/threonine protein phosphatase PrpC
MRLTWAAASDPGIRRHVNEDSFCVRPDLGLYVVADGMGGHVAGEVASRIAVETIERFLTETATRDRERTWPVQYDPALHHDANRLTAAFKLANRRIGDEAARRAALKGMATTASALLVRNGAPALVAHVGDSRIYLHRGGALSRVTTDHSWVEEQVRAGVLDREAANQHPWRHVVTRALSGGGDPEVDVAELSLAPGDRVLLCSDGLSSVVSDDRIAGTVGAVDGDLEVVCRRLVSIANDEGGPDNVTIIVIQCDVA